MTFAAQDPSTRIVLIGAESTGKSTLVAGLQARLGLPATGEFVRSYAAALDRPLQRSDLDTIARGQLAEEDRFGRAPRVLHDTNLLSTLIYADHYFGVRQDWLERCFAARDYALYLLCMPDIPWVADPGQREGPEARAQLHDRFAAELHERRLPYVRMHGDATRRLEAAVQRIAALPPRAP